MNESAWVVVAFVVMGAVACAGRPANNELPDLGHDRQVDQLDDAGNAGDAAIDLVADDLASPSDIPSSDPSPTDSSSVTDTVSDSGRLCQSPLDCPPATQACAMAVCHGGSCATVNVPAGTVLMQDVPADCEAVVCDGLGNLVKAPDLTNVPTSPLPCVIGTCDSSGMTSSEPIPVGMPCMAAAGSWCDGAGHCVECLSDGDCLPAKTCSPNHHCVTLPCMDGLVDQDESDVDCGGAVCPPCGVGQHCREHADCESHFCNAATSTCLSPLCTNGQLDGDESAVDCGGPCLPCPINAACRVDQDCLSNTCDPVQLVCTGDHCQDQRLDGDETDVDCGGSCPPCDVGGKCAKPEDCITNACELLSGTCITDACKDGVQHGLESDIDCGGGVCPGCKVGQKCRAPADCQSKGCDAFTHRCVSNACNDRQKDNAETDVDCGGGGCGPCHVGQRCEVNFDCQSGHICTMGNPRVCQ